MTTAQSPQQQHQQQHQQPAQQPRSRPTGPVARARAALAGAGAALRRFWASVVALPRQQKVAAGVASGVAVLVLVALAAIPGPGAAAPTADLAGSGEQLFERLMQQRPQLRDDSRIERGAARGSSTNRLVLPEDLWHMLDQDQRVALGSWLDSLGGRWEIRVGVMTADGTAVRDTEAMIDSQAWHQQLR